MDGQGVREGQVFRKGIGGRGVCEEGESPQKGVWAGLEKGR